jgi:catechol 2,3-dioxygenase-like lactoylglutathione lyase family enzyme
MRGGIVGLHHGAVNVRDWSASLAFYRDVLGLELLNEGEALGSEMDQATGYPGVRLRYAMFRVGRQHFELIQYLEPAPGVASGQHHDTGATHIAFKVRDIDLAYAELSSKGVAFLGPPARFREYVPVGGAFAYALDPNGVLLEFIEDVHLPPGDGGAEAVASGV